MNRMIRVLLLSTLLLVPRIAGSAPITDPDDPRTWQGASIETFRVLFGYATRQDLVNANLLDDGVFPPTAAYSTTFVLPSAPCGTQPAGIAAPTYIGTVQGCSGYSNDPASYAYSCGGATVEEYGARGNCLDMWWLQDGGDGDVPTGNVWDLGGPSNQTAVFPIIDHGPLPQEAIEYTVYLSNNPNATTVGTDGSTQWVLATLDKVYLEGWISTWIADGFTTVWRLGGGQTFRYVNVVSGGVGSIQHDGDDEIDTVIGLTSGGEPVCPGSADRDGDGVCDETDNCPDVPNPLQEDADHDSIGDVCDEGCSESNVPPSFASPTPECGAVINAAPGGAVAFSVAASDPDQGDVVTLNASGVPAGATLTPPLPASGNPVSSAFAWTPGAGDTGDHVVTFAAADQCAALAECSVTIRVTDNRDPDCSAARPAIAVLWPPNHRLAPVEILGVTDPDGDQVHVAVTAVTQDESRDDRGDGSTCGDAVIGDGGAVQVRAERSGRGDGRVYRIEFTATDGRGGACDGAVSVCVPHDQRPGATCFDDGQTVNSLGPCEDGRGDRPTLEISKVSRGIATIQFSLPAESDATLAVYDITGRRVAIIEQGRMPAGAQAVTCKTSGLPRALYFVQLRAAGQSVAKRLIVIDR